MAAIENAKVVGLGHAYETAVKMYHQQHERWTQWTVFFLGSVLSIIVVWSQVREDVPFWAAALPAAVVSALGISAAENIRGQAYSWQIVVEETEAALQRACAGDERQVVTLPFARFQELLAEFDRLEDLKATLNIFSPVPYQSVTRLLVLIAGATASSLFGLATYSIVTQIWP